MTSFGKALLSLMSSSLGQPPMEFPIDGWEVGRFKKTQEVWVQYRGDSVARTDGEYIIGNRRSYDRYHYDMLEILKVLRRYTNAHEFIWDIAPTKRLYVGLQTNIVFEDGPTLNTILKEDGSEYIIDEKNKDVAVLAIQHHGISNLGPCHVCGHPFFRYSTQSCICKNCVLNSERTLIL